MVEGFKNTEIGIIPEDWETPCIKDFTDLLSGGTPSTRINEYWGGDIRWMNSGELNLKRVYEVEGRITELGLKNSATKLIPSNCVLIGLAGQGKTRGTVALNYTPLCTNQSIASILPNKKVLSEYIYQNLDLRYDELRGLSTGDGGRGGLNLTIIRNLQIPLPPTKAEQTAIATALNDADALITQLEKLIAKKKAMKQGAMQELLSPKEGWDWTTVEKLGKPYGGLSGKSKNDFDSGNCPYIPFMNVMSNPIIDNTFFRFVKIGSTENQNKALKGDLFFNGSSETPEELGMCSVLLEDVPNLYLNSFCFGFRLNKELQNDGLYLAYFFRSSFGRKIFTILAQGATRHNLSKANFNKIEIQIPNPEEQKRISEIIKDMDNEIFEYEKKLEKQKQIKQGMMQSLLTGKIRLIKQQESPQTIEFKPEKSLNRNHYFEDAVLIAAIVNNFYSEKYVLGRKKVQKLLYLLRRKQEADTNAFKRKAAGPYADEVRYKGGEPIAKNKKYINISSSKLGTIFSKGEQIGEALGYIEKWEMHSDMNWLVSQFKFKTVDQLELLATIDMAICDLQKENKVASLENIKNLIKLDKEWKAKLEREIFSDGNIQLAIRQRFDLFEQQI